MLLDKLPHKLKLVKEVSLELSLRKGEDQKVVMWVLDSFSTLVSNALKAKAAKNARLEFEFGGVISTLFDLNTSIIPVAVCSSATTAGALNESKIYFICSFSYFPPNSLALLSLLVNPHIWVRARSIYPPIIEDTAELRKFVKSLGSKSSAVLSEELVNDMISSFGGCLLFYENLLGNNTTIETDFNKLKEVHTEQLKSALNLQKMQVFSEESLERYELLQAVARGDKISNNASPAAKYLLAKHGDIQAFLGIHPEGYLTFALPMTKRSLEEIEPLIRPKIQIINSPQSSPPPPASKWF